MRQKRYFQRTTATANNLKRAVAELAAYCIAVMPRYELAPHHRLIIEYLERVERGEIDRLLIQTAPRHGKSTTVAQLFPSWHLGRHPTDSVIVATYGAELSIDHGRRVRGFLDSSLHRMIFPASRIADDNSASHRLGLTAGGSFFATSVGGVLTGKGANVLVLDDLLKDAETAYSVTARASLKQWFEHVLYPRLEPGGRIVAIGTRWHRSDLLATLLTEYAADGWVTLSLPAIAEPDDALGRPEGAALWESRFPLEALQRIRTAIGSTAFAALYQQRPQPAEGHIFRKEWLKTYTNAPEFFRLVFSLDTAFKTGEGNDYSVLAVIAESITGYYLLDLVRERLDFPQLMSRTKAKAEFWHPHAVLIEDAASGASLIQSLKVDTTLPVLPVKPLGDKESRASAVSPLFESGRVFVPQAAPWLSDLVDELTSFPAAPHDDQVDALTQALTWLHGQVRHSYHGYQGIKRGDTTTAADSTWLQAAGYRESRDEAMRNFEEDQMGGGRGNAFSVLVGRSGAWLRQRGY